MKYQIKAVEFSNATVVAAAAPDKDGSLTLYVNTQCSQEKQEEALQELLGRISAGELKEEKRV